MTGFIFKYVTALTPGRFRQNTYILQAQLKYMLRWLKMARKSLKLLYNHTALHRAFKPQYHTISVSLYLWLSLSLYVFSRAQ